MTAIKSTLLLVISVLFLFSCSKNDDANLIDENNSSWHLTNINGGIQGSDIEYTEGEIVWSFNSKEGSLFVDVNLKEATPINNYHFLEDGSYEYKIEDEDGIESLHINNFKIGILTIQKDELHISNGHVDGYNYIFKR